MKREDDFQERRKHLVALTEDELEKRFWDLADKLVDPLIDLAKTNTSQSIERSVLLRMGFSSEEAKIIVEGAIDRGLIGKGVGNLIYKLHLSKNISIREAGIELLKDNMWDDVIALFGGEI
jgi:D-ornithine 4,5-aminomutase subunit alpha